MHDSYLQQHAASWGWIWLHGWRNPQIEPLFARCELQERVLALLAQGTIWLSICWLKGQFGSAIAEKAGKDPHICRNRTADANPDIYTDPTSDSQQPHSVQEVGTDFLAYLRDVSHRVQVRPCSLEVVMDGTVRLSDVSYDRSDDAGCHVDLRFTVAPGIPP